MADIVIYTTPFCGFCHRAKMLLDSKKVDYTEIDVMMDPSARQDMIDRAGRTSVPQIFVDTAHVGGCDELFALEQEGKLDRLLRGPE